jgi:hypothetical protein
MARTKSRWRRRLARELVPAVIGLGAVALITVISSGNALGVVLEPVHSPASTCSWHAPEAAPTCIREQP